MKQTKKKLLALLLATVSGGALTLFGCSTQISSSVIPDSSSGTSEDVELPTETLFHKNLATYKGVQEENDLKYVNSINLNNEYHLYYFKLGTIQNTPIHSSVALQYTYDTDVSFRFTQLTEEGIEESMTNATETIDTHSYTWGNSTSEQLEVEIKPDFDGFSIGGVKGVDTNSEDHHWTDNWGETVTNSNTRVDTYVSTFSQEYEETVHFSQEAGFEKGKYYRMSFYEELTAYGVLIYNVANNSYSVSYQQMLNPNNTLRVWEVSEDGAFDYDVSNQLYFNVNKAIEYAQNNQLKRIEKKQVIDLTACYTYDGADLSKIQGDNGYFDQTTGIFTAYGAINGVMVDTYVFRGAYGLPDSEGRIIRSTLDGFSIKIQSEHDIKLEFENMYFTGVDGAPTVYRSAETENQVFHDTIQSSGIGNNIYAKGVTSDGNGQDCISLQNLTVTGNAPMFVYGGNGKDGTNGSAGGNGVVCNTLKINNTAKLTVVGGNGGNGANGANGAKGANGARKDVMNSTAPNGKTGGAGGVGGNGGQGGYAIKVTEKIQVLAGSVDLQGGNAGNAGNGGAGGKGGVGGKGGNAYYGSAAVNVEQIQSYQTATVTVITGSDGAVGVGGAGGAGGDKGKNDGGAACPGKKNGKDGAAGATGANGNYLNTVAADIILVGITGV